MSGETKTPWVAGSVLVDGRVPDDEAIVYVGGDADSGPEVEIVIRGPGAAQISVLIAAAPDLYAFAEEVRRRCIEMGMPGHELCTLAEAALSKAVSP